MKARTLKQVARVSFAVFVFTQEISPLWAQSSKAQTPATHPLILEALREYAKATPAYDRKGLSEFFAALPARSLSDEDQRFLIRQIKGVGPLPSLTLSGPNRVVISDPRSGSRVAPIVVELTNPATNEFLVNGIRVRGSQKSDENYKAIFEIVKQGSHNSARAESKNDSLVSELWDLMLPSAHAGGASLSTLIIVGLVAAAAGLITYFVVKNNSGGNKNKSESSNTLKLGDPTVVKESTHS
jgi:hypothetical protein